MEDFTIDEQHCPRFYDILKQYAEEFIAEYKRNLEESGRRASGQLIDNISYRIEVRGSDITVLMGVADYFRYVEEGKEPGERPDPQAILKWIQDKPITPYPMSNGKLPTPEQLTFLISRKIAEEGYEGSHDLQKTVDIVNPKYEPLLSQALERDFGEWFEIRFTNDIAKMLGV